MFFYVLISTHFVLCVLLIGLVLLQQGKGADMGAAFGGGSNSIFGASGAGNFITRATTILAVMFMVTSIGLALFYSRAGSIPGALKVRESNPLAGSVMEQSGTQASEGKPEEKKAETVPDAKPLPVQAGSDTNTESSGAASTAK